LTAVPHDNGTFVRWTGDVPGGATDENPLTILMDSDKTITAKFKCAGSGVGVFPLAALTIAIGLTLVSRSRHRG
jgi:hypothetical protein